MYIPQFGGGVGQAGDMVWLVADPFLESFSLVEHPMTNLQFTLILVQRADDFWILDFKTGILVELALQTKPNKLNKNQNARTQPTPNKPNRFQSFS